MTVGERIDQIRKDAGLSQKEFAEKLGVSVATMSRVIGNLQELNQTAKNLLGASYNVNLQWLETGEGNPYQSEGLVDSLSDVLKDYPAVLRAVRLATAKMSVQDWQKLNDFIESLGGTL